jgi:aspartyl-tRNA(Asn)/glutamyl-tRNA(Gln) amidotransferase subunit A
LISIRELSGKFEDLSVSPIEFTSETLTRIEGKQKELNCFITILNDAAIAQAEASERRYAKRQSLGPLDGVPIAIKDLFYIEGVRCTAGSKILSRNVATYDSPAVSRLKKAGAVLIGTANMHEFASGITGENPHYGSVRNPWDLTRISGGSSSGSAAAVAARLSVSALGTDTAGSVRTPASLCGIVGLKPTYGRISRLGVIPLASSFDTVGILSSSVWDSAALLMILSGHDPEDLTTVAAPTVDYVSDLSASFEGLKVGVPRKCFGENVDPLVLKVFEQFLDRLMSIGCTTVDLELGGLDSVRDCWRTIRLSEATAFHSRWIETSPQLYGDDVLLLLKEGMKFTAVEYVNAQNMRPGLMQAFAHSMENVDVMATPTTSIAAPKVGQAMARVGDREMEVRTALTQNTLPFNVVGFPAISIPAGLCNGLPIGVQLISGPFEESKLLRLAFAMEEKYRFPEPPRTV